jgi:SAM-dependent methyltransferase
MENIHFMPLTDITRGRNFASRASRGRSPAAPQRQDQGGGAMTIDLKKLKKPMPKDITPWDLLQPVDEQRFGKVVFDRKEQERWSKAIFVGGLPYMYRKAYLVLDMIYGLLELKEGDKVFLIGEALEACGFVDDLKARVGASGTVTALDIQEDCRDAFFNNKRGVGGQRGTFRYNYTSSIPDEAYDVVINLQAIQHADEWRETGKEFLRIMKPGRRLVMAEIHLGAPQQDWKIRQDLHIEHLIDKIMSRICGSILEFPYYSMQELHEAFAGQLEEMEDFEWRGLEVFWGRKPR